jgi:hypothetical protein
MRRSACVAVVVSLAAAAVQGASAQSGTQETIRSALAAAPRSIAAAAAVADLNGRELRAGTNGWTCYPDVPSTPGTDPMCVDATWASWVQAWMGHTDPQVDRVGLAYMLSGGSDASNTDPFATQPAPGRAWIDSGPHVMLIVPDARLLAALPTDPMNGGPYVMWKQTPYAHVMMPVGTGQTMMGH